MTLGVLLKPHFDDFGPTTLSRPAYIPEEPQKSCVVKFSKSFEPLNLLYKILKQVKTWYITLSCTINMIRIHTIGSDTDQLGLLVGRKIFG